MVPLSPLHVPPMPSRHTAQNRLFLDCESGGRARQPIQKGSPDLSYFFGTQVVAHHQQIERIVARNARVLAPVIVEKMLSIEVDEVSQQTPECLIRRGLYPKNRGAPKFRQFPYAQRHLAQCTEGPSSAALQRPKQ